MVCGRVGKDSGLPDDENVRPSVLIIEDDPSNKRNCSPSARQRRLHNPCGLRWRSGPRHVLSHSTKHHHTGRQYAGHGWLGHARQASTSLRDSGDNADGGQAKQDIIKGLELGADDYLVKPFGIKELIARVTTVLRRTSLVL